MLRVLIVSTLALMLTGCPAAMYVAENDFTYENTIGAPIEAPRNVPTRILGSNDNAWVTVEFTLMPGSGWPQNVRLLKRTGFVDSELVENLVRQFRFPANKPGSYRYSLYFDRTTPEVAATPFLPVLDEEMPDANKPIELLRSQPDEAVSLFASARAQCPDMKIEQSINPDTVIGEWHFTRHYRLPKSLDLANAGAEDDLRASFLCLFSSIGHLSDPEVYRLTARFLDPAVFDKPKLQASLLLMADAIERRELPESTDNDELLKAAVAVRWMIFNRYLPVFPKDYRGYASEFGKDCIALMNEISETTLAEDAPPVEEFQIDVEQQRIEATCTTEFEQHVGHRRLASLWYRNGNMDRYFSELGNAIDAIPFTGKVAHQYMKVVVAHALNSNSLLQMDEFVDAVFASVDVDYPFEQ